MGNLDRSTLTGRLSEEVTGHIRTLGTVDFGADPLPNFALEFRGTRRNAMLQEVCNRLCRDALVESWSKMNFMSVDLPLQTLPKTQSRSVS